MGKPIVVWSPEYEVDIGPHVFPTIKYRLVRDRLLATGSWQEEDFVRPEPATAEMLLRVHTSDYLRRIRDDALGAMERILLEVPFSQPLRRAAEVSAGGTLLTARLALRDGIAVHVGGGFHHAFADHGEGFCLLNDVAVAAMELLATREVQRIAVVDLDVHQGNGTAELFADDPRVFTFSIHQEDNYPPRKPPSDLDVGLDDGVGDAGYMTILETHLPGILERHRPELVFYLAGADPYREDQLGGLRLSQDGLARRDAYVLRRARAAGAAVAVTLAGGYAFRQADTVEIHVRTVEEARLAAESAGADLSAGR